MTVDRISLSPNPTGSQVNQCLSNQQGPLRKHAHSCCPRQQEWAGPGPVGCPGRRLRVYLLTACGSLPFAGFFFNSTTVLILGGRGRGRLLGRGGRLGEQKHSINKHPGQAPSVVPTKPARRTAGCVFTAVDIWRPEQDQSPSWLPGLLLRLLLGPSWHQACCPRLQQPTETCRLNSRCAFLEGRRTSSKVKVSARPTDPKQPCWARRDL